MEDRKDGKDFEEAVAKFVQALGPGFSIRKDIKLADRDTGTDRQCDVLVEGKFLDHFPIKYLISCKDKGRKLSIEDITAFKGQIDSVGASCGAIFSHTGFSEPAIAKAKAIGIPCCRLYTNQPADIPEVILLRAYAVLPIVAFGARGVGKIEPPVKTWGDLFEIELSSEPAGVKTLLDALVQAHKKAEEEAIAESESEGHLFPSDFHGSISIEPSGALVTVFGSWNKYKAPLSAHFVNGSFSMTDGGFRGQQFSPAIDTWNPPGPWWVPIVDDEEVPLGVTMTLLPDMRAMAIRDIAPQPLPPDAFKEVGE